MLWVATCLLTINDGDAMTTFYLTVDGMVAPLLELLAMKRSIQDFHYS